MLNSARSRPNAWFGLNNSTNRVSLPKLRATLHLTIATGSTAVSSDAVGETVGVDVRGAAELGAVVAVGVATTAEPDGGAELGALDEREGGVTAELVADGFASPPQEAAIRTHAMPK